MGRLIGLVGHAGSGKDAVARVLVEEHGFTRLAFADPLRILVQQLHLVSAHPYRSQEWLEDWDYAKRNCTPVRAALQDLGIAARKYMGEDVWLRALLRDIRVLPHDTDVVVPDVRFLNELYMFEGLGGVCLEVRRPGVEKLNGHAAESEIDDVAASTTCVVRNDGTLDDLSVAVNSILSTLYDE